MRSLYLFIHPWHNSRKVVLVFPGKVIQRYLVKVGWSFGDLNDFFFFFLSISTCANIYLSVGRFMGCHMIMPETHFRCLASILWTGERDIDFDPTKER